MGCWVRRASRHSLLKRVKDDFSHFRPRQALLHCTCSHTRHRILALAERALGGGKTRVNPVTGQRSTDTSGVQQNMSRKTELPAYSTAGLIQYSIISTARCGAAWYGARAPMVLSIRVWIRGWLEDGGHPGCYRPRFNNKRPRLPSWNPWSGRHYDGSVKSGPADGSVPSEGDNKSMTSDEEA